MDCTESLPIRHAIIVCTPRSEDRHKRCSETALKGTPLDCCAYARAATARLTCAWIVESASGAHSHSHGSYSEPTYMPYYHRRHTDVRRPHKRCSEAALKGIALDRRAYARAAVARLATTRIVERAARTYSHIHGSYRLAHNLILSLSAHGGQKTPQT